MIFNLSHKKFPNYAFGLIVFSWLLIFPKLSVGQYEYKEFNFDTNKSSVLIKDSLGKKPCEIKDFGDVFRSLFHKKKVSNSNDKEVIRSEKKVNFLILPKITYNPSNGFMLGAGGNITALLGPKDRTKISAFSFTLAVTSKKQFLSYIKSNIYTPNNKFFLSGDWRYYKYSEDTYGLGTNSPDSVEVKPGWGWQGAVTTDVGGYSMIYNYVIFHEVANVKVVNNFYIGLGYELDYYWNIVDENLKIDTTPQQLTPHWIYSKHHDFDTAKYTQSGFSINLMYDSRDNQINAYKGIYALLNYRMNPTWLGSSQNSTELWLEFKSYIGLSKRTPRHLIAFWTYANFLVSGDQPYFTLMATGDDQQARSGRGYTIGRFRGQDYMYAEIEYRFPLQRCAQTIGGVIFANASTASNRDRNVNLFDYIGPAVGFGFRILINKHNRMNLDIDFAFGLKSKGVYMGGTEVF